MKQPYIVKVSTGSAPDNSFVKLRRQVRALKDENDFLKSALADLRRSATRELEMRDAHIKKLDIEAGELASAVRQLKARKK
ncbi:hypothetical protein HU675_0038345 [Bradyrhizobium septentrionale]|uniref:hypothetical protein n=1 Tax=Bradyrhizobium septentrionale TaxID=1404411 RepID=UPI001596F3AD|nr:hypothetical protein [Bradyrhizobium septentrionale]UGY23748.1 hypothetical protein HU675_0038345 [Bradyrhizobium septentrionale]